MGYRYNVFTGDFDLVDITIVPPTYANEFVTDAGSAIPASHILNIVGGNSVTTSGIGNTVTIKNLADITKYVVDFTSGATGYTTIQSAITQAQADAVAIGHTLVVIYVRPGNYVENLIFTPVAIGGYEIAVVGSDPENTTIVGTHTPSGYGEVTFANLKLLAPGSTDLFSTAAGSVTHLNLDNCVVEIANGYLLNADNYIGQLHINNCRDASTNNGFIYNTAGSTTVVINNSTVGAGTGNSYTLTNSPSCTIQSSNIRCPGTFNGTTPVTATMGSRFEGTITTADAASVSVSNSSIATNVHSAIVHNSTGAFSLTETSIDTSNATAIDGTGNLSLGSVSFLDSNTIANTITLTSSEIRGGNFISRYVVDPDGMTQYSTIQSALDAVNSDGITGAQVFIKPGIYTEDLTFYDGIQLTSPSEQSVTIIGTHTPPSSGTLNINRMAFQSATDIFYSTAAGTTAIIMEDCSVEVTNGYTFNLPNWAAAGSVAVFNIGPFGTNDGFFYNTGGAQFYAYAAGIGNGTANTLTISGAASFANQILVGCPVEFASGASGTSFGSAYTNTVTTSGTATVSFSGDNFSTGANQAITHNSSAQVSLSNITIDSSNNPCIGGTGVGNLLIGSVTYLDDTNVAGTLTKTYTTRLETGELKLADTDEGVLFASTGVVDSTGAMLNGELLIGSTGLNPQTANLASAGGTIAITNGAGTINLETGGTVATTFATDAGNAVPAAGTLTIAGGTNISTSGAGSTVTIDLTATIPVTLGGTGVTSITDHALIVGSGTAAVTEIGPLGSGELVIGSAGADPVAASLTQPAAGITITGGAGSITFALADDLAGIEALATTGIVSRTAADTYAATSVTQHAILIGDAGELPTNLGPLTNGQLILGSTGAQPVAGLPTNGSNITWTGGAGTLQADLTGTTDHCVQVGNATGSITSIGVGATGEVLIGNTGADPSFSATPSVTSLTATTVYATTFDTNVAAAAVTLSGTTLSADGTDANIPITITPKGTEAVTIDGLDYPMADGNAGECITTNGAGVLSIGVLTVPGGGTGANTLTDHGVLVGSGAGAITPLAAATNGQLIIGSTGADPAVATLASADGSVTITNGAGTIDLAAATGLTWSVETGAAVAAAVNYGYITNRAGGITYTLPTTAAVGSIIKICSISGLATIAQNAGESIVFGLQTTTVGVGGSLVMTDDGDAIEIVCTVADTQWNVLSSVGNWTVN